ncbi:hypothetical protein XENOCAPTIV_021003, partial [Xenoophorus captivus]
SHRCRPLAAVVGHNCLYRHLPHPIGQQAAGLQAKADTVSILPVPEVQVQVELSHHLTTAAVLHTVQCYVRMPDKRPINQLKAKIQQSLSHHLHWVVLLQ